MGGLGGLGGMEGAGGGRPAAGLGCGAMRARGVSCPEARPCRTCAPPTHTHTPPCELEYVGGMRFFSQVQQGVLHSETCVSVFFARSVGSRERAPWTRERRPGPFMPIHAHHAHGPFIPANEFYRTKRKRPIHHDRDAGEGCLRGRLRVGCDVPRRPRYSMPAHPPTRTPP
jgi:hypothetical protein